MQALAKKMTVLYKLAREQLSKASHYDFGLRALKSVLVMAGALKRASPDMPEALVLMRALRNMNLPKFVYDDVPLFLGLIRDLFPGEGTLTPGSCVCRMLLLKHPLILFGKPLRSMRLDAYLSTKHTMSQSRTPLPFHSFPMMNCALQAWKARARAAMRSASVMRLRPSCGSAACKC